MPVKPDYIFRIAAPYTKTQADVLEINTDNAANLKWKDAYKTFKLRIRDYLKIRQNGRCAFCRCRVNVGTSHATLEHIVSKTDYSQFQTLSENIVYCCWVCNMSKKKRNTLNNPVANKLIQTFPNTSNGFIIINPYHDDYQSHIDFLDEVIIVVNGDSSKGANTIKFYNLTRPELAEERAREFKLDQKDLNHQLLSRLTETTTSQDVVDQINNIITNMPNWTL